MIVVNFEFKLFKPYMLLANYNIRHMIKAVNMIEINMSKIIYM